MGEWNVLVTNDSISINKHLLRFVCSTPYRPPPPQRSIYNTTTRGAAASGCFTLILILLELVVVLMMILLPLRTFSPTFREWACNNNIVKITCEFKWTSICHLILPIHKCMFLFRGRINTIF